VAPRSGLNGCGKSHTDWDSIPVPPSPYEVKSTTQLTVRV